MIRISVVGNSGSGKSTLSAQLAETLGCPHVELDSMYHQADWEPLPRDDFRARLAPLLEADSWVVDGNYSDLVQDMVWERADTVVWLDLPRRTVMPSVIKRTMGRTLLSRELWNGNREQLRNLINRDPRENILLWSWTRDPIFRQEMEMRMVDDRWAGLDFIRLTSRRALREWIGVLS